jgi:hypothetical protein
MFRAFLAHHQEILYCLVSRYGKRKCGRAVWCPVVSLVWSVFPWHCLSVEIKLNKVTTVSDIKLDIYIYIYFMMHGTMNLKF